MDIPFAANNPPSRASYREKLLSLPQDEDGTQVKENSPSGAPKVAPNDDDGSVHVAPENREVAKELNNLYDNSHSNHEDLFGPWMLVQRAKNKRKPRGGHVTKGNSSIGNKKN
ncbi:unnamed protein product [Lupinus luteus]|uniref:Uncharacterized protein n=1 Tax=Lupinus luteus TaxID=3873 RepID=A0AAV1X033_LUPLU